MCIFKRTKLLSGFLGASSFTVFISYAECNKEMVVILCTIGISFGGFFFSGINANTLDIAPNYSGVVMGISNCIGSTAGFIVPYAVGLLTPNVCGYAFIQFKLKFCLKLMMLFRVYSHL